MRLKILLAAALLLPVLGQASVADEIAALEQAKPQQGAQLPDFGLPGNLPARTAPAKPPNLMTLTDGRRVNLNDYAVVVFMQRGSPCSLSFQRPARRRTALSHNCSCDDGHGKIYR